METKLGHIKITDKVNFVYHELSEPNLDDFRKHRTWSHVGHIGYRVALNEYKLSKKKVEVSNAMGEIWLGKVDIYINGMKKIINNQPCEAEVTDTALVTKIL